jgi:hypothetical protein
MPITVQQLFSKLSESSMLTGASEQFTSICSMLINFTLSSILRRNQVVLGGVVLLTSFGVDISVSQIGIISDGYSLVVLLRVLCGSVPCPKFSAPRSSYMADKHARCVSTTEGRIGKDGIQAEFGPFVGAVFPHIGPSLVGVWALCP